MSNFAYQRRKEILGYLKRKGVCETKDLADLLSVSESTIRRDLEKLAEEGKLKRIHGGAKKENHPNSHPYQGKTIAFEPALEEKMEVNKQEKTKIGKKAAEMALDGEVLFIGLGTTTLHIIEQLRSTAELQFVTYSLLHAFKLMNFPNFRVSITGGQTRKNSFAIAGPEAKKFVKQHHFDLFFFGVNGISIDQGLSLPSTSEADIAGEVIKSSKKSIVVADYTKFEQHSYAKISDIGEIDTIITDDQVGSEYIDEIESKGTELIIAN